MTQTDQLIERIAHMDRTELISMLRGLKCDFQIDFTDDYLMSISLERLRHVTFAAALHDHPAT
jgi:hypothetical protein